MNKAKSLLVVLLLAMSAIALADAPEKVLFVGNSFTYYNNSVHNHYRELIRSGNPDNEAPGRARSMTISGGYLPEHAGGLLIILASQDWDVVVIQGYSTGPISESSAGPFRDAARDYAAQIRTTSTRLYLAPTWRRAHSMRHCRTNRRKSSATMRAWTKM